MVIHDVETYLLEMEVGVGIYEGISAHLNTLFTLLYKVLFQCRGVVRGLVAAEPSHVGTNLYAHHLSINELQIEVTVDIHKRERQYLLVGRVL